MVLLDVLCLVFALVAVAFAVVALVRARAADERAAVAAAAVARAETTAHAAAAGVEHLESQVAQARHEAASATQQAGRAAQAAAQASAAAAASRREAEAASDKAEHADAEARAAIENATRPVVTVDEVEGETDDVASATGEAPPVTHASVRRAEDHDVAGADTGATERVVQVAWRLERVRGGIWALRNTGLASARDALLSDATVPPKYVRPDEVIPRDVDRDDVLQFRVMAARGAPPPRIRVTWREAAGSPAYSREFTVLTAS